MTDGPMKIEETQRESHTEECHVMQEANIGVMLPQAKETRAPRRQKSQGKTPPRRVRGSTALLTTDFRSLGSRNVRE